MNINAKDLLRFEIQPFLFGVLFSRISGSDESEIPEEFFIYTSFRKSKAVNNNTFDLKNYAIELKDKYNQYSGYNNWEIYRSSPNLVELRFNILNDINSNIETFYNSVYRKLMQEDWMYTSELTEEKKMFVRGFMETRGSVDTTAKFIAQDYFYNSSFELKRIQLLPDFIGIPPEYMNFNARELQKQYVDGTNRRNTQLRINSMYYAKTIGFINEYKSLIFENSHSKKSDRKIKNGIIYYDVNLPVIRSSTKFLNYINFFTNNIYNTELTKDKVESIREELGFYGVDSNTDDKARRDRTIVKLFESIHPDRCAICKTTKTFEHKASGRQAFDIHHVIPYHNGKEFDNMGNLVKLCATCHDSLKRGRSTQEKQIQNIIRIFHNEPQVYEYVSSTIGIEDIYDLSIEIQKLLG